MLGDVKEALNDSGVSKKKRDKMVDSIVKTLHCGSENECKKRMKGALRLLRKLFPGKQTEDVIKKLHDDPQTVTLVEDDYDY